MDTVEVGMLGPQPRKKDLNRRAERSRSWLQSPSMSMAP